jgi:hypothetical protein
LTTLLYTNDHPLDMFEQLENTADQAGFDIEYVSEEEKPFSFKLKIQVENQMIPLEGPSEGNRDDMDFKKEEVEMVLDLTDCSGQRELGYNYCMEFRNTDAANSVAFYQAFNDLSVIFEDFSTTLNNDDE